MEMIPVNGYRKTTFTLIVLFAALTRGSTTSAQEQTATRPCLSKVDGKNLEALTGCYYEAGGRFLYPGPCDLVAVGATAR